MTASICSNLLVAIIWQPRGCVNWSARTGGTGQDKLSGRPPAGYAPFAGQEWGDAGLTEVAGKAGKPPAVRLPAMSTTTAGQHLWRERSGLAVLTWSAFDGHDIDAFVTTRDGGTSTGPYASLNLGLHVGDDERQVVRNRIRVADALDASLDDFVFCDQAHLPNVAVVTDEDRGRGTHSAADAIARTDALVTTAPGIVLVVMVADCVPLVLHDPVAGVLACVHAGWRGTVAKVTEAALTAMASLGARPRDVIAGIGPGIAPGRYQVGDDVADAAALAFGSFTSGVLRPDGTGKWLFDTWAANRLTLRQAGVREHNIHLARVPTGPDTGQFYSHRAEQPCGRFALVARLAPGGRQ